MMQLCHCKAEEKYMYSWGNGGAVYVLYHVFQLGVKFDALLPSFAHSCFMNPQKKLSRFQHRFIENVIYKIFMLKYLQSYTDIVTFVDHDGIRTDIFKA